MRLGVVVYAAEFLTSSFLILNTRGAELFVDLNSPNPTPPYSNWYSAAKDVQSALDAASSGDLILVTDGVYQVGGRLIDGNVTTNRVAITNSITLQSVNGPAVTVIQGYQVPGTINGDSAIRCVYMVSGAVLSGFTLTGGATTQISYEGGGVLAPIYSSAVVSNCIITGNSAYYDAGGAEGCTLNNCTISGNQAASNGGGAVSSTLNNCIVSGNSAGTGGGALQSTFNNCTITDNVAGNGGGGYQCNMYNCLVTGNVAGANQGGGGDAYATLINCTVVGNHCNSFSGGTGGGTYKCNLENCIVYDNSSYSKAYTPNYIAGSLNYCCTMPMPTNGSGNFISAPLYLNGSYQLQSNSPCINAGNNAYTIGAIDLNGNPRIVGGTVDIGAYEYQTPSSVLSYAWAQQYGLPIDGSADYMDSDGDGMNNWQEWKADTNPTNPASVLALQAPATTNTSGITLTWQSVNTRNYYLQSSTNLPAFFSIQSNIVGQAGFTSFTDTAATNGGPYFYRVGVQ
jgi:hypothetical protein